MTTRAILSIVLFIVIYLMLIILAFGLTTLCAYAGISLIIAYPSIVTLILGPCIASMGILVLIFLFKFLTKTHIVDRSHLIEITEEQQPELFQFIREIVKETHTGFPKKVYLSGDVNAAVFYDSNFWSMFFPVRKNLQIGLALVNTNSKNEFKAILAHEFGHFSQRSMKVGSYVYNVNRIIYNMLYDNASYDALAQSWANISGYLSFFVIITVKIVQVIQWCLKQVYHVVNLNYMALSREMEFHADAVAASVTGSSPLITSLLRTDLADSSYTAVLAFYNERIKDAQKTKDIYTQQQFILQFLATEHDLPIKNNLPLVSPEHISRYNKSKLNITNQWASHPSVKDRIRELQKLNSKKNRSADESAGVLFRNIDELQRELTQKLFSTVRYAKVPVDMELHEFIETFTNEYRKNSFSKFFNNYYDHKNPCLFLDNANTTPAFLSDPFNDQMVDQLYTSLSLENDIAILKQIAIENYPVKSFDYDGLKYAAKDCKKLIPQLEKELNMLQKTIEEHDKKIHSHFLKLAIHKDQEAILNSHYQCLSKAVETYDKKRSFYMHISSATDFFQEKTRYEAIEEHILSLKNFENDLKKYIQELLKDEQAQSEMTDGIRKNLTHYSDSNLIYFRNQKYDSVNVNILYTAITNFHYLISKLYFLEKQRFLNYLEQLTSDIIEKIPRY